MEHPRFKDIIRNYVNRQLRNQDQDQFGLEAIIARAKEKYSDLDIRLNTNDENIVTDMFFAFTNDRERCNIFSERIR